MQRYLIPLFILGTIGMMFIMDKTGSMLKTTGAPHGIICLEVANTTQKTEAILNSWAPTANTNRIDAAKFNTYTDFLFLFFYAGLFFLLCRKIADNTTGRFSGAGYVLANAAIFAGIADMVENTGMLFSLNSFISPVVSFTTALFSYIKWGIVALIALYLLSGLSLLLYLWIKRKFFTRY